MFDDVLRVIGSIGLGLLLVQPAAAQAATEGGKIKLQLNNMQTVDGSCQLTFVAQNDTDIDVSASVFSMTVVDVQGHVVALTNFEFGAFPKGRPKAQQFALAGQACDSLSAIAVNDFISCLDAEGKESPVCETALQASTLTTIQFPWSL
ncbi:hypothetical protein ABIB57_004924 [Devosia sp. UYZn731]|uniref:hypothetical protein n=1 Tax=Devosia sp. UYZn731 TaxID=3156345 RepID=UPI0033916D37